MLKISRISIQKGNRDRYNIYIHNGKTEDYGFSVDEDILIQYNLRKGLELSKEKIAQLKYEDNVHKNYNQVINFLSYRMRSEQEVREYLIKKEVDQDYIDQIIQKLIDQNFIDDQEFARLFIKSRIRTSTKGPIFIKKELMDKGVSEQYAEEALKKYTFAIEIEKATKIVEKRLKRSSKHSFQRQIDQARAALQRNGFSHDIISEVMTQFRENIDEQAEWDAIQHQGEKLFNRHRKKYESYDLHQKVKEGLYRLGFSIDLINKYLEKHK